MAWYKISSRFMVDTFRRHNMKITVAPRIPLQISVSTINFSHRSSSSVSRFSRYCQPLLSSFVSPNALKNRQRYKSPFLDGSKRFFNNVDTDIKMLEHIKPKRFQFWMQNPGILLITGLLGCGVVFIAYYWNLERVPYTQRSHFVLLPTYLENKLGRSLFTKSTKSKHKGKILPPLDPLSIRVQRIGQEIVEAAEKGLRKDEECLMIFFFKKMGKRDNHQIPQFEWEFVVIDDDDLTAFGYCFLGGKVVITTDFLYRCYSDSEIATVIGHEVGHAIARHGAECLTRFPVLIILCSFLYRRINLHLMPAISKFLARLPYFQRLRCPAILKSFVYCMANLSLIHVISKYLIRLPNSRRIEKEADYIGLILVALAGYDPRAVVKVLEYDDDWPSSYGDFASSHPNKKERARLLSQPEVMEEALSLYTEVRAQRDRRDKPHSRLSTPNVMDKALSLYRRVVGANANSHIPNVLKDAKC